MWLCLLRVADHGHTRLLDPRAIFRFGLVGRLVHPPEFNEKTRECVRTFVPAHRPKIFRMENLLADMGLKRNENRTVRNCFEKRRKEDLVLRQTQSESVEEDNRTSVMFGVAWDA